MSKSGLDLDDAELPLDLSELFFISQGGNPRKTTLGNLRSALLGAIGDDFLDIAIYDPAGIAEQLVGLTASQTLTNKTLTAPFINSPALSADSVDALTEIAAVLKTGNDAKLVTGTAGATGRIGTWDANGDLIDGGSSIANVLARANHTGTQVLATISDAGALAALSDLSTFDADDLAASATRLWMTTGERTKVGHLTVTAATDLDAIRPKVAFLTVTGATDLDTIRTKVGHITVTQAVDLDAIETRVNALDAAVVLQGTWDASGGTFPGGGTAQAGDSYIVSVGGTVDGQVFTANDRILAIVDNASTTTYAANWHKLDYTDAVLSVAGRTGAVTLALADITDMSANGRSLVALTYANMRAALDLEPGTDFYSISAADAAIAAVISDTAYAGSWNGVTTIAPSKNAVYDKIEAVIALIPTVSDTAYGSGWNGDTTVAPSKNAVYDKIESLGTPPMTLEAADFVPTVTNGAQRYVAEDPTNDLMEDSLAFDPSTQEFATVDFNPPAGYAGGTFTVTPAHRLTGSAAQTVQWGFSAIFIRNDDAMDAAPGTVVTSDDTWLADGDYHVGPATSALTPGGTWATGSRIRLKVQRNVASDNVSGDARLQNVLLTF